MQLVAVLLQVGLVEIKLLLFEGWCLLRQVVSVDVRPLEYLPAADDFVERVNQEVQLVDWVLLDVVELRYLVMHYGDHLAGKRFRLLVVHVSFKVECIPHKFVLGLFYLVLLLHEIRILLHFVELVTLVVAACGAAMVFPEV